VNAARRLVLRREALAELTTGDLTSVVGGQALTQLPQNSCPVKDCVAFTDYVSCLVCQSYPCHTQAPNCA
jgi:hypothetical protein